MVTLSTRLNDKRTAKSVVRDSSIHKEFNAHYLH